MGKLRPAHGADCASGTTAPGRSHLTAIVTRSNQLDDCYYEGGADPRREGVVLGDLYGVY